MKNVLIVSVLALVLGAFAQADDRIVRDGRTVSFVTCEKCDRWMRFAADGRSATVNLARVRDRAAAAERAFALMKLADDTRTGGRTRPLMGWSSWNTFRVNISEEIILSAARAMATNGLGAAGYRYVNIDDGFFDGHGPDGVLRFHPKRFPNGMKGTVDGIHALGFKAGIYSDAGADTCGSIYDADKGGIGAGLYGHDDADFKLHFIDLGFDFIKIDYCGGKKLKLDERQRYAEIAAAIKRTGRKDVRFNVCRWDFPGTWIADISDSWRTTGDIRANWKSLKSIVRENLYLSPYAKKGHYNDMDMLEVGHYLGHMENALIKDDIGFTPDEELTHFGLWCILSSPLLIGCDVRTIPETTKALVTNPYLLMMNQNDLGLQAFVAKREKDAYVLVKDADSLFGRARYVAFYNGGDGPCTLRVSARDLDLGGTLRLLDLVERADLGPAAEPMTVTLAPHASRFFRVDADERLERTVYEAETAFLTEYQELTDAAAAGTAHVREYPGASGGVAVCFLGNRETNDLVWRDVNVLRPGSRTLEFLCSAPDGDRTFDVQVDGGPKRRLSVKSTGGGFVPVSLEAELGKGVHTIRLSNATGWAPDIDFLRISDGAIAGKN